MSYRPPAVLPLPGARGQRLTRIAHSLRARTRAQAQGRCMTTALAFCHAALQENVAAEVVVWAVKGDPDFLDHWAVLLGHHRVVDLTRMQVDGRTDLSYTLEDYPANFARRRVYPAQIFMPIFEAHLRDADKQSTHFSFAQLSKLRWLMLKHDRQGGSSGVHIARVAHSAASWLKLVLVGAVRTLSQGLDQRRDHLQACLQDGLHPHQAL
jgi:hypothetical protein